MSTRFDRLRLARASPPTILLVVLLATAHAASGTDLVAALRGKSWFENAAGSSPMAGYYEQLIDSSRDPNRHINAEPAPIDPVPPGVVIFRNAGIVDESATYLRWRMKPDLDVRWNGNRFRTNRHGYRSPDVAIPKPAGVYRILVFGSSYTMGHGVNDDDCYPRHLERWLNRQLGPDRPRVEVVNLAVSGDSPTRRLERMRAEGRRFEGDWWLCDASPLDYFLEEGHLRAVVAEGIAIPFGFVREALQRAGISAGDGPAEFPRKLRGELEGLLEGSYGGWGAEATRAGAPLTVVLLPRSDHQMNNGRIYQLMRALARRHQLDIIDASQAFAGLDEARLHASAWDKHPSALGHRAIFEAIRAELLRRGGMARLRWRSVP